ncbi:MAG: hypothetical protein H6905_07295 [Hyphomicrobiales bacterium]|nr:hypothetical protein [Hyphomicrobiales bacterium]
MCAEIIHFPCKLQAANHVIEEKSTGILEIAFAIHEMIAEGIEAGDFDGNPTEASATLYKMLKARYGGLAYKAEKAFELIYGVDPIVFLGHVTSYRD